MSSALATFIFEAANFVVLAAVLGWLFFSPIRRALQDRRDALARQTADAAISRARAEQALAEVQAQRGALDAELEETRHAAREAAKREADALLAASRDEVQRQRRAVQQETASLQQAQTARLGLAVARAAHQVTVRLLDDVAGPDLDAALLRSACRELCARPDGAAAAAPGPVTVESARPLGAEERTALEAALGGPAEYRVVADLVAGLRVAGPRGLVDASVAGLATFAEHVLAYQIQSLLRENGRDRDGGH